jgi:hypothetical protein
MNALGEPWNLLTTTRVIATCTHRFLSWQTGPNPLVMYSSFEVVDSGSTAVGGLLADLNTTAPPCNMSRLSYCCVAWRERMVIGKSEISMFGRSFGTWKVQLGDHQIENKPASGSVEELSVCRAQVLGLYIAVTSIHEI